MCKKREALDHLFFCMLEWSFRIYYAAYCHLKYVSKRNEKKEPAITLEISKEEDAVDVFCALSSEPEHS